MPPSNRVPTTSGHSSLATGHPSPVTRHRGEGVIERVLRVGEVARYLRELIDTDDLLQSAWVAGEISNVGLSPQGHYYFSLRDGGSQLPCVLFRTLSQWAGVAPENGMAAVAHGRVSIYEPRGIYQLVVDALQRQGVGPLRLRFEELKARLEREGLFDPARKRPLPPWPRRIGVATSPAGAVFWDIVKVVRRRYPKVELVLAPCLVQGDGAPASIAAAIEGLCRLGGVDVVIVARGGGSEEELWGFNEEQVVRAIYACPIPVVSAVGHETDVTLADLAADARAPTPSAAAELVVPSRAEWCRRVAADLAAMRHAVRTRLNHLSANLSLQQDALARYEPGRLVAQRRQQVDDLWAALFALATRDFDHRREQLAACRGTLRALDPRLTLRRGFSITYRADDGRVVESTRLVAPGEAVRVQLADGELECEVESVR